MNFQTKKVVIIGGGFGGLNAAKTLDSPNIEVTLIDARNFHLFQPLLYQVATGGLSPADIAFPIRAIFNKQKNVNVVLGKVTDIDFDSKRVYLSESSFEYDFLIIATGAHHHYFGNEQWADYAKGLKTLEDATVIRSKLLSAFEQAELETNVNKRKSLLTFVIIGGGPTGVELSGAISELAHETLRDDFRSINPSDAKIILIEGSERILPPYPESLSKNAINVLTKFDVEVMTNSIVIEVKPSLVKVKKNNQTIDIETNTILWAAGVKAESLSQLLVDKYNVQHDKNGRLTVDGYCRLDGHNSIFVIGDLANFVDDNNRSLPGIAAVAIQQGKYVADVISKNKTVEKFNYRDKGNLAVIGRSYAVAFRGDKKISGFVAWLLWIFVHLLYLMGFENRILVSIQWAFNYFTKNRSARLITEEMKIYEVKKV